jgi:PAS domain S-box-containing protein
VFEELHELLVRLLPLDFAGVNVLEPGGRLVIVVDIQGDGVVTPWNWGVTYEIDGTFSEAIVLEGRSGHFSTPDRTTFARRYPGSLPTFDAGLRSLIGAPLFSQGKSYGALILASRDVDAYNDAHVDVVERVAAQISGPIAHARLYAQFQRAEESARESAATYRALIENMDAAISFKDMDGRYVVVNQRFADQVGMSEEQIAGRTASEVYSRQIDIDQVEALDREVTQSAKSMEYDSDGPLDDGRMFETRKAPVMDKEGNVTGIVAIATDVT